MDKERRSFYPPRWRKVSYDFRASKNFTCEHCHAVQGVTERISRRTGAVYQVSTHAAHKHFGETRKADAPKLCLCEKCHGTYDTSLRRREQRIALEQFKHRRLMGRQNEPFQRRSML